MILLAFLLFGLGAADFVGVRIAALATICSVAIAVGVGVVMATVAGIDWWWACSVTASVVLWRLATSARIRSNLASLVAVERHRSARVACGTGATPCARITPEQRSPRGGRDAFAPVQRARLEATTHDASAGSR